MTLCPVSWNDFEKENKGKYSKSEMSESWLQYKKENNIVGTIRSEAQKRKFLKQLAESGKAHKWMNQWLKKGLVPPGYEVDHRIALSVGGEDIPANLLASCLERNVIICSFRF